MQFFQRVSVVCGSHGRAAGEVGTGLVSAGLRLAGLIILLAGACCGQTASTHSPLNIKPQAAIVNASPSPPRVTQARRFLVQRGWVPGQSRIRQAGRPNLSGSRAQSSSKNTSTWQSMGPGAALTPNYGLVTGRISALAFDPSDPTGNRLFAGSTGGGVWRSQNAATTSTSSVMFVPLTDNLEALGGAADASISIGALTVQPGATGVILAGTGDPNDALDSYYGAGVLRSADGGNTWSLTSTTADHKWSFDGEGFAGFAWSAVNPQLVVAAVSQAYVGLLVNAMLPQLSYEGLYYSQDSGVTWNLATIRDGSGADVQGPNDTFARPGGNAATAVVWNPVRQLFVAAVRFHGYYQSSDGVTWARMNAQPGSGLDSGACPTNSGSTGSVGCPMFRGSLAVNPQTGDTFAWTVDINNQDQGLWQDACTLLAGACTSPVVLFARKWNTAALETSTLEGPATIADGDYTLALSAMPAGAGLAQDTLVFAGAVDLWKCSLAMGCVWRNTTNVASCMSAQVAPFQHSVAWNPANPQEMFLGNDSGLWRSLDAIGESGAVCSATDASHFQNLNGGLGSLAEVTSLAVAGSDQNTMLAGLGVNGTAGANNLTGSDPDWPQMLGGYGGPVAIDPVNAANWYVNAEEGVSIFLCPYGPACTAPDFGNSPVVKDADVGGDGLTMTTPAPFLVDPLDSTQLLVGTCRVWRGPANGVGWSESNAISPIFDTDATSGSCNGDALIRSMAAMSLGGGDEVVYLGMYGSLDGGAILPGHVLAARFNPTGGSAPRWLDLTLNPVTNDSNTLNYYGLDISSIFIDPHDPTGNTIYVTVAGVPRQLVEVKMVYQSTDGGAHWTDLMSNIPWAPVNGVVVDPQDAGTVYIATDVGVYFTTDVANCAGAAPCWAEFGTGLPEAPVVGITANSSTQSLIAATYGRGIWEASLWTAGNGMTTAAASPASIEFGSQAFGTVSGKQIVTLTNIGSVALIPAAITLSGDFSETDNCQGVTVAAGASCAIQVVFTPTSTGNRIGQMIVGCNVFGGQLTVDLTGTGTPAGAVAVTPAMLSFGEVQVGNVSAALQIEAANSSGIVVPISRITITSPFSIVSNSCGTTALAADGDCQLTVDFAPAQAGTVAGALTFTDGAGTQTVTLTGTGATAPTDTLSAPLLSFPATQVGQLSALQAVSLFNSGGMPLTSIAVSVTGPFQVASSCGTELAAGSTCSFTVTFAPVSAGNLSGTLTLTDAVGKQTVSLSGSGVADAALSVSPPSLTFAAQMVGGASAPLAMTVTNSGGSPLANVGFQIKGASADSFSIGATTCGALLNNGSNCTAQVIFTPASAGGLAATLTVSSSTAGVAPVSLALNGTGQVTSGLSVSPSQMTFAAVAPGQTSSAQNVEVSNTSGVKASGLALAISAQFVLTGNTCGSSIAVGASCSVGVVFQPAAAGPATGTLTVSSTTIATAATVALSGTGGGLGAIEATPAVISFGTVGVGGTSAATTVTVSNPNATVFSNLAIAAPAGFQLASNTCKATLEAGASCTLGVEFAPTAAGAQSADLNITSSTGSAGAVVALSGMGFDFNVEASGTASQTVSSGQTASYGLVITPLGGVQGTFTMQCGTLPANTTCQFKPASNSIGVGASGNVAVQVLTGQPRSSAELAAPFTWRTVPISLGLLLLPMAMLQRMRRMRKALWLGALAAVLAGGVSSCTSAGGGSGGGGGGGSDNSTPSGNYSIQLTATSTGVTHSLTVTLNVD
jgi:hypothetical protein